MPVFNAQGAVVNSPAWIKARIGHLTASRMKDVIDFRKDGKPGAARIKYMQDLVAERLTDLAVNHPVNAAMEWGLMTEPEAKQAFMDATGVELQDAEFILHPEIEFFGCTPDALVGQDALAEFKCPTTTTFVDWRMAGVVPDEHKPQMLAQLACTRRSFCYFVAYDPRIKDEKARLFVRKFEPSREEIAEVERHAREFLAEVDAMFWKVAEAV